MKYWKDSAYILANCKICFELWTETSWNLLAEKQPSHVSKKNIMRLKLMTGNRLYLSYFIYLIIWEVYTSLNFPCYPKITVKFLEATNTGCIEAFSLLSGRRWVCNRQSWIQGIISKPIVHLNDTHLPTHPTRVIFLTSPLFHFTLLWLHNKPMTIFPPAQTFLSL